jgi:hypothetical protein
MGQVLKGEIPLKLWTNLDLPLKTSMTRRKEELEDRQESSSGLKLNHAT